ncbi:hypothetical protein C8Q77DRAFT_1115717 [Trametes polyzona]|nr:hypothetical protein C8Q77DRAFT_1115717 [Trametes polyzona]
MNLTCTSCSVPNVTINAPGSTAGNPDPSTSDRKARSTPVAAIVGGVMGGVALVALAIAVACLVRRRKQRDSRLAARQHDGSSSSALLSGPQCVTPYYLQTPEIPDDGPSSTPPLGERTPLPAAGSTGADALPVPPRSSRRLLIIPPLKGRMPTTPPAQPPPRSLSNLSSHDPTNSNVGTPSGSSSRRMPAGRDRLDSRGGGGARVPVSEVAGLRTEIVRLREVMQGMRPRPAGDTETLPEYTCG